MALTIRDVPHLNRWLKKHEWPDKKIIYAISHEGGGRISPELWMEYKNIPEHHNQVIGRRVIMRREDKPKTAGGFPNVMYVDIKCANQGEGGVGGGVPPSSSTDPQTLDELLSDSTGHTDGDRSSGPQATTDETGIGKSINNKSSNNSSDYNKDLNRLREAWKRVEEGKRLLSIERDELFRDKNAFIKQVQNELISLDALRANVNKGQHATANILETWTDAAKGILEQGQNALDRQGVLLDRLARAEEKQALAAAASYSVDKLTSMLALWRVKKIEDLPPDMALRFAEFAKFEAEKHFFEVMPGSAKKIAEAFYLLSKEEKGVFLRYVNDSIQREAAKEKEARERDAARKKESAK